MRNKRGQFYLVAAIIIVMVISGIASVKTYAFAKSEPRKIQDISLELREESSRIIDYGIYSKENLTELLNKFTDEDFAPYFLEKTENTQIVFIYGNASELYSVQYQPNFTGVVYATLGGGISQWSMKKNYVNRTLFDVSGTDKMNVTLLNQTFEFEIRNNKMFYFVIAQEKEGEYYRYPKDERWCRRRPR